MSKEHYLLKTNRGHLEVTLKSRCWINSWAVPPPTFAQ